MVYAVPTNRLIQRAWPNDYQPKESARVRFSTLCAVVGQEGRGLAKHIYHSGRSEDLFEALKLLKFEYPDSPIVLIGFSLGGNIVLKLVGELNALGHRYLKGVIAVSPPVDLYSSVQMIGQPDNAFYERYFYKLLRADVVYRHKKFKDLPPCDLPKNLKLYEFDQIYTAP